MSEVLETRLAADEKCIRGMLPADVVIGSAQGIFILLTASLCPES